VSIHFDFRSVACATALLTTSSFALAEDAYLGGWSQISGLTLTVVDLDLNDGVAAAYWFDGSTSSGDPTLGYTNGLARTGLGGSNPNVMDSRIDSYANFLSPGFVSSAQNGTAAGVSVNSSGMQTSGAIALSGASFASTVRSATQPIPGGYPYTLWVTPNTQLVVTAVATTFAAVSTGCNWQVATSLCGSVHAEASLSGRVIDGGVVSEILSSKISSDAGSGAFYTYDQSGLPMFVTGPNADQFGPLNLSTSVLSITFTNNTTSARSEYLELESTVVAQAIPEPSTYALMIAGLAALSWAARRRRGAQLRFVQ
jgi:hypothetical protein